MGQERNLNSVQEIASDPALLYATADHLQQMGGIPGRMGNMLKALFDIDKMLTKEGTSVMSTVARHLSFLDSEMVAVSLADSTFNVREVLEPGVTLFMQIPPSQIEAQKGLLRCWVSTLIREIGSSGSEEKSEVLFLLDEASILGSLPGIEEALVRGRSAGCRLLLAYQSDAQVITAFKDKPGLLYDACGTQIYLGASSYETAERISKTLGSWTQTVESGGTNSGGSRNTEGGNGGSVSWGQSANYAPQARPLMFPDEILRMGDDYLIAFQRGLPAPILARRVKWYEDPAFNPAAPKRRRQWRIVWLLWGALVVAFCALAIHAKVSGYGYWQHKRIEMKHGWNETNGNLKRNEVQRGKDR